jgi:hypothetical protein
VERERSNKTTHALLLAAVERAVEAQEESADLLRAQHALIALLRDTREHSEERRRARRAAREARESAYGNGQHDAGELRPPG